MHRRTSLHAAPLPAHRSPRRSFFGHVQPALPLPDRPSDEEVFAHLLRDESEASWRSFLARFEPLILSTILRAARARGLGLARDEIDEIRAGFVATLLANDRRPLRAFDPTRGVTPAAWLAMLTDRHAIDCLRARHTRTRHQGADLSLHEDDLSLRDGLHPHAPTPEELALHKEQLERMRRAAGTLARRQRELYTLLVEQGLELTEVAGRMGTSLQTVHSCRHKMERSLRSAVQRMTNDAALAVA